MFPAKDPAWVLELVEGCQRNDADAWTELIRYYQPRLTHVVSRWVGKSALVDEIVGEVFSRLWERGLLHRFNPGRGTFRAFLWALAWQRVLVRSRARKKGPASLAESCEPPDHRLIPQFVDARVEEYRSTLPPRQRTYLDHHVLTDPGASPQGSFSAANAWQMDRLLRKRWKTFEAGE